MAMILCNNVQRIDGSIDADKCVSMALIHDAHEALIGNVGNSVRSLISDWKDIEVRLFDELQFPEELRNYFREYRYGLSTEGKIVNLSDKLATLIRACVYARAGYDTRELIINYKELVEKKCWVNSQVLLGRSLITSSNPSFHGVITVPSLTPSVMSLLSEPNLPQPTT
ncbi:HD domain-containing protein [Vulcanisaeta sp. JCM 16161]|uniref:HD domain-containing protein n=1 Tax=Vulcanisaeta sp. JCM 16161 TaxID=1295372 RepID=UPI001FB4A4BE|nr:HD domain-containing protein [Vulcanisaeta sp. JCM 16161]